MDITYTKEGIRVETKKGVNNLKGPKSSLFLSEGDNQWILDWTESGIPALHVRTIKAASLCILGVSATIPSGGVLVATIGRSEGASCIRISTPGGNTTNLPMSHPLYVKHLAAQRLFLTLGDQLHIGTLQAPEAKQAINTNPVATTLEKYAITTDDSVVVTFSNTIQESNVNWKGQILILPVGEIKVYGMSQEEASFYIHNLIGEKTARQENVDIQIFPHNYKTISIIGGVTNPTMFRYPKHKRVTLELLITESGGFSALADREKILIKGTDKVHTVNFNEARGIEIQPSDSIIVPVKTSPLAAPFATDPLRPPLNFEKP